MKTILNFSPQKPFSTCAKLNRGSRGNRNFCLALPTHWWAVHNDSISRRDGVQCRQDTCFVCCSGWREGMFMSWTSWHANIKLKCINSMSAVIQNMHRTQSVSNEHRAHIARTSSSTLCWISLRTCKRVMHSMLYMHFRMHLTVNAENLFFFLSLWMPKIIVCVHLRNWKRFDMNETLNYRFRVASSAMECWRYLCPTVELTIEVLMVAVHRSCRRFCAAHEWI